MVELICKSESSQGDLEAFRLLKPIAGQLITLSATKHENGVGSDTRIAFENLALTFHNLNIGYDGMGPGCLVQILSELGMDKDTLSKIVEKCKAELMVVGNDVTTMR